MKILFATDGSKPAREGELLIASLFDRSVKVQAFSVAPEPNYWFGMERELAADRMDLPVFNGNQVAAEAADRLGKEGFVTSSSGFRGIPGPEILQEAEKEAVDAIVLGASHSTWMGNVLLGSISSFVLHHAPCSVLIVHRAPTGSGKILFGTDGSDHAHETMQLATELLDNERCTFQVVTAVVDPLLSITVYPPGPPFGSYPEYRRLEEERVENGWHTVERACDELREKGFKAESAVLKGSATHQLLKESDNISADLLVVGSRGLGPVRRTFLGSVSDQLVRHAPATLVGRSA